MENNAVITNKKIYYISFLQVIGPILVIFGHMMNGMEYNEILNPIKKYIYVFHMPLFFFISGYLFSYKGGIRTTYKEFMVKKVWRLLFPYIVLNILFILPKILLNSFLTDNVETSLSYIFNVMIYPRNNILGHTWFLVALFILYAFGPLWTWVLKKKNYVIWGIILVLLMALNLNAIDTRLLTIGDLCKDTLYFVLGIILAIIPEKGITKIFTKRVFSLIVLLAISSSALWITLNNVFTTMFLCCVVLFMLFLLPISFNMKDSKFTKLYKYSFSVYILHWPCMLAIRIIFYQILKWNSLLVEGLMLITGIIAPFIIIKIAEKLKQRFSINSKIIYYLIGV